MRFGCVTAEVGRLASLAEMGFDYAELSGRALASMRDDDVFDEIRDRILAAPIAVEAISGFIPPYTGLTVVGPRVDRAAGRKFAERMLIRAAQVGVKTIAFGSAAARNVPDGFSVSRALAQLRDYTSMVCDLAEPRGMVLALEVLCRSETNLINTVPQAIELVHAVNRPGLRVLIDYYNLLCEESPLSDVAAARGLLAHVHTSDDDRDPPGSGSADQTGFLAALRGIGYDERLTIECHWEDFEKEAPKALDFLRREWAQTAMMAPGQK